MREFLQRLRARWRLIRSHGDELNRRATVEAILLEMSEGKRPLPTKEECALLAYKLGTPTAYQSKALRDIK